MQTEPGRALDAAGAGLRTRMPQESRVASGALKSSHAARGFGFDSQPEGEDVRVRPPAISRHGFKTLAEGEALEFDVTCGPKGLRAANVRKVGQERPRCRVLPLGGVCKEGRTRHSCPVPTGARAAPGTEPDRQDTPETLQMTAVMSSS